MAQLTSNRTSYLLSEPEIEFDGTEEMYAALHMCSDNIFWQRRLKLKIQVRLGIGVFRRKGGKAKNMGYIFWCLHSQSRTYYARVVSGLVL